jgi:hypothetical protein
MLSCFKLLIREKIPIIYVNMDSYREIVIEKDISIILPIRI